jgi:signal transduction histidine kinase
VINPPIVTRLEGLFPRTVHLFTVGTAVLTLLGGALLAWITILTPNADRNVWQTELLQDMPLLWLLTCVQCIAAYWVNHWYRQGKRRAAAWSFFFIGVIGAPIAGYSQPAIASLLGVGLIGLPLLVLPHIRRSDVRLMQLIVIAAIGMTAFRINVLMSSTPLTFQQTLLRSTGLAIGVLLCITAFSSLYFNLLDALRAAERAQTASAISEQRLRTEAAVRLRAQQRLESQNAYLTALHDTGMNLVRRLDQTELLTAIVRRVCDLVKAEHAFVSIVTEDGLMTRNAVSLGLFETATGKGPTFMRRGEGMVGHVWLSGELLTVEDYRQWPGAIPVPDDPVRAIVVSPMISGGEFVGAIGIAHVDPLRRFTPEQTDVIQRLSQLAAVALQNARLYALSRGNESVLESRVAERTRELAAMLNIANVMSAAFDLTTALPRFFDELRLIVPFTSAAILVPHGIEHLKVIGCSGLAYAGHGPDTVWPLSGPMADIFALRKPVCIADTQMNNAAHVERYNDYMQTVRRGQTLRTEQPFSWLGVPLLAQDQVIGILVLDHLEPNGHTESSVLLATAAAAQAALAIANSRLYTQSVQAAAAAERSRLARDLHDSVSQAVFSMALGARSMETLSRIDPSRALEPLPHVIALAEAALTEMRALIFELQPESLAKEGLIAAVRKHADAARARHNLNLTVDVDMSEPDVDLKIKEALYRVSVEAIHNAVKHARARAIVIALHMTHGALRLSVQDDGIGFDAEAIPYGHFGLQSMREHLTQIGGQLCIESHAGAGARIVAIAPLARAIAAVHA